VIADGDRRNAAADGLDHARALVAKNATAGGDRLVKAADGLEAAVGERFVNEGPEMLSRL